ncbi:ABC transporter substrate-binding protein [Terrisporobacter sp.]|uniref:ABC transporter substrate-binding protein n=1 Tax=Terrisporobacter sp. TaxID=1965305 RepID=UPI0026245A09|nr:ABC transporter substrate-binding protein [Terrisporobacter sp.]
MKKKLLAILTSFILLFAVGCSSNKETTVTDREGNEVKISTKLERIISAVPSNTEVLVELGVADKLVGVDKYSEGIEGLDEKLPKMDMNNPDAEAIIALEPDIIIASGHNKVGSAEDPYKAIVDAGIPVVYIPSSDSIDGIYKDIEFMASLVDKEKKGEEIISNMKEEIAKYEKLGKTVKEKKKVYFEIGPAPDLFTLGNSTFINEMIEIIGAENIFKDQEGWIPPTEESIIDANPDVILTTVNYVDDATGEILARDGWEDITAIKNKDVYYIDSNSASRPSHHILKALEEMSKVVYPDVFNK